MKETLLPGRWRIEPTLRELLMFVTSGAVGKLDIITKRVHNTHAQNITIQRQIIQNASTYNVQNHIATI